MFFAIYYLYKMENVLEWQQDNIGMIFSFYLQVYGEIFIPEKRKEIIISYAED